MAPDSSPPVSLLTGVDWLVIAYAAGMATLMSVLVTLRARNQQAATGQPLPGWATLIPDTLLGGLVGTLAALFMPELLPVLKTFAGLSLTAGVGGAIGPKLVDWLGRNALDLALDWVGAGSGRLAEAVKRRQAQEVGHDETRPE